METVVVERSISACKQMKMMRRSSENLAPVNYNIHGGLLQAPPSSFSPFNHRYQHLQQAQRQQHQHPPLLPLPVPNRPPHHHQSLPSRTPGASRSPAARKTNNMITRSQSLTPKKPKSKPSKKEATNKQDFEAISERLIIASPNPLGPDPNDLPKDVTRVLLSSIGKSLGGGGGGVTGVSDKEKFSGSIFTLSPPPSSLPLPRFSLQPRLGCNAEAAVGIDAGATDNLCRLLRLR